MSTPRQHTRWLCHLAPSLPFLPKSRIRPRLFHSNPSRQCLESVSKRHYLDCGSQRRCYRKGNPSKPKQPRESWESETRKDYLPIIVNRIKSSFNWKSFLFTTLNTFLIGHLVLSYVCYVSPTRGPSMIPTIRHSGDWVFVSRLHRRGRWIEVGDLVTYNHPMREGWRGIKRVVGMPGDFVLRDTPEEGEGWMVQVPEGHCWIVGDNLDASRDSRMFGPLPLALVRGKVMAKVWPPHWFKNGLTND